MRLGEIGSIDVASLLEIMNRRIEFLYDRETHPWRCFLP